jgi:glycogen synthase
LKILISSHLFYPSVGGIETVTELIAAEFAALGHEVQIVTQTRAGGERVFPYLIHRCPKRGVLLKLLQWCDVYLHNNISLQTAWPLLIYRRPWVVAHHVWITRPDGHLSWQDRVKNGLLRWAENICISESIASALPVTSTVVGDPYADDLFGESKVVQRDRDVVFLGRLVSDKGADVLLQAVEYLRQQGRKLEVTIIGEGDQRTVLEREAGESVQFVGAKRGVELVELLQRHRLLVVPSRWVEPFGIVALEGIACGCLVIGSEQGGLRDAIGACGLTFPNGDVEALTKEMVRLLDDPILQQQCREAAPTHLSRFTRRAIAEKYLAAMERAKN